MYTIIAIMGKSGSGKSHLLKWLANFLEMTHSTNINIILPTTTRPMRPGEIPGKDYNFISEKEMFQKIANQQVAELSMFRDWYYATLWENLNEDKLNIGILTPHAISVLEEEPNVKIIKIYISCPSEQRLIRSLGRKDPDIKEIIRRYEADEWDFRDITADYYVNNADGKFLEATNYLWGVIASLGKTD